MAVDSTIKQFANFSKGMMTEATPLNFPENYSLNEENMRLNVDGSRQRRNGVEFEVGGAETTTDTTTAQVGMHFYKWEFADDIAENTLGVVQVGQKLWFMDMSTTIPSANLLNGGGSQDLSAIMSSATTTPKLSFSSMNGILIICSADFYNPIKLKYDTATDTVTLENQSILVRDLWGVDDGLAVDEEETGALSVKHEYNLLNQGWIDANITTWALPAPANVHVMHLGKDSAGVWSEATLRESFFGNSPAPKGKHIINFFDRGTGTATIPDAVYNREVASGVGAGLDADLEQGIVSQVAVNWGRIYYAGSETALSDGDSKSPNASSLILFTQIIEREAQFGNCYTEADPTAEVIHNQVDSDGGFIQIPELGKVIAMIPMANQLIVLASNGVWSIVSVDGQFTPTAYQVNKVTSVGALGAESAVEVEGTVVYWSTSGIYQLKIDDVSQQAVVADVTLQTIKGFFNNISDDAKNNAKGYYDSVTKQIGWLYQSDADWDFANFPDFCDKELVYDLQLQAFTVNTHSSLTTNSPYVVGAVIGEGLKELEEVIDIVSIGDDVWANGDDVEIVITSEIQTTSALKFLTYTPLSGFAQFTLSEYTEETFHDWNTEDFESFIETGYIGFEDFARNKSVTYLIVHCTRTEDGFTVGLEAENQSSCEVQARWEWNDSAQGGRYGRVFQAYRYKRLFIPEDSDDRFDTGQRVISTRNKLRGRGKALSLHFSSEEGKNLILLGFAITATGTTNV